METKPEILFVDDEESVRKMLPPVLESFGFKVTSAASVPEALRLMAEKKFDVLISDLNIEHPGDGFTVISAMRSTQPNAVRFILTGYPAIDSALEAIRQEVHDYLIKPTDTEELVEKIRSSLSERKPAQQIKPKRLTDLIRANVEPITAKWLESVKQDAELHSIRLSESERKDHVPGLLASSIALVEGKELTTEDRKISAMHGEIRNSQGYSLPLIIREARLLQDAIAFTVQRNLLAIQISTLIPDMVRLFTAIQMLLEESVGAFIRQEKQADGSVRRKSGKTSRT